MRADMYTNAQTLLHYYTTPAAQLGCVARVHSNNFNTSFFRFVLKQFLELAQPSVVRAQGKIAIAGHEIKRQILKSNQSICIYNLVCQFMPEVAALVRNTLIQFRHKKSGFAAAMAALFAARQSTLGNTQSHQRSAQPARVLNQRAIAERDQAVQPHIHSNRWAGVVRCDWIGQFDLQTDVPFLNIVLYNNMFDFGVVRQRAVIFDLNLSDVLNIEKRTVFVVKAQFASITVAELQAVKTVSALEARKARLLANPDSTKECLKRLIKTAQHLLYTGRIQLAQGVRIGVTLVTEMRPLRGVRDALACFFVGVNTLFERGVVHLAPLPEQKVKRDGLRAIWIETIFIGANQCLRPLLIFDVALDCFFRKHALPHR